MATSIPENAVATFATELKKYEGFVPVTSLNASIVNPEWLAMRGGAATRRFV